MKMLFFVDGFEARENGVFCGWKCMDGEGYVGKSNFKVCNFWVI